VTKGKIKCGRDDWDSKYEIHQDATFNLAHSLDQMLPVCPPHRDGISPYASAHPLFDILFADQDRRRSRRKQAQQKNASRQVKPPQAKRSRN
jgi:hypothetical protein